MENNWRVVTLDDHLRIVNVESAKTGGLAHQKALKITDDGFRARVVEPEEAEDVDYLFSQVLEKREMGFIGEYGNIPNGTRTPGDGCRTIGKMIYPAFGGMIEGVLPGVDTTEKNVATHPLPFDNITGENPCGCREVGHHYCKALSSIDLRSDDKKIQEKIGYNIRIG